MEVIKTELDGVVIIEPRIFKDERGYFYEQNCTGCHEPDPGKGHPDG